MNLLTKLLPLKNIALGLEVSSKKRLFEQAGLVFENNHGIARSTVFDSLFARERLGSTGLGHAIAVPHGRIKGIKEAVGAFFRLATPVPFDAPDGAPVGLVFVLLVPDHAGQQHLEILAELAHFFSDREVRAQLMNAPTAAQLYKVIQHWSPQRNETYVPDQRRAAG